MAAEEKMQELINPYRKSARQLQRARAQQTEQPGTWLRRLAAWILPYRRAMKLSAAIPGAMRRTR